MTTRKGFIVTAIAALATGIAFADAGNWKVPRWWAFLSAPDAVKKVVNGKCSGHSQGMCVTSNAFYFSFHNQIVKTDWKGRFLKRAEVVPHGGDICHWNGRVYVGVWEPPAKKGEKGCTAIKVYDAETLEPIGEPFVVSHGEPSSCGGQNLTTDGTYIYVCYYTGDEAARTPNFIVFDKDFKVVGKHVSGRACGVNSPTPTCQSLNQNAI